VHQQPYGPYAPPPPPRSSRLPAALGGCAVGVAISIAFAIVVATVASMEPVDPQARATNSPSVAATRSARAAATGTQQAQPTAKDEKQPDGKHVVVYTISGSATKGLVTWMTPSGISQANGAKLPWTKTISMGDGASLSVSAQNAAGGTIKCTISVDGEVVKSGSSSGSYAIASCAGIIGF